MSTTHRRLPVRRKGMSRGKKTTLIVTGIIALLYIPFYLYGFNSPIHATIQTDAGGFANNQTVNCGTFNHRKDVVLPAGYYYLNGVDCNGEFKQTEQAALILSPVVLPFLLAFIICGGPIVAMLFMGIFGAPGAIIGSITEISPGHWRIRFWR
jgi:hypothetical protein